MHATIKIFPYPKAVYTALPRTVKSRRGQGLYTINRAAYALFAFISPSILCFVPSPSPESTYELMSDNDYKHLFFFKGLRHACLPLTLGGSPSGSRWCALFQNFETSPRYELVATTGAEIRCEGIGVSMTLGGFWAVIQIRYALPYWVDW